MLYNLSDSRQRRFFLGANTPQGFVSRFDQLEKADEGWDACILKGGPGTGKSSLMKAVGKAIVDNHLSRQLELIHCSSDVQSLDAILAEDCRWYIVDGTAPHTVDAKFPGAYERLVALGNCWDEAQLKANREEIIRLFRLNSAAHERARRFLTAAGSLISNLYRIALPYTDLEKINRFAAALANRELKPLSKCRGKESVRFLSAVTNQGITFFAGTANYLCDRIYLVEDRYGAVSRQLLGQLRELALSRGYNVTACYCVISPFEKLEHLFIPELRLGFMTSNRFHPLSSPAVEPYRVIHAARFTDSEGIKEKKQLLQFTYKAALQLLEETTKDLKEAKAIHDQLESYYVKAMDFQKVEEITDDIIRTLSGREKA